MTDGEWSEMVYGLLTEVITPMGQLMSISTLPHNLIIWMAWSGNVIYADHVPTVRFTGSPQVVFNREHHRGGLGSYFGDCPVNSTAAFGPLSGMFSLSFDYNAYIAEPLCMQALDPAILGYNPLYDSAFVLSYDARSLAVATAINLRLTNLDLLTPMDTPPTWKDRVWRWESIMIPGSQV